jgi:hypothetical protein
MVGCTAAVHPGTREARGTLSCWPALVLLCFSSAADCSMFTLSHSHKCTRALLFDTYDMLSSCVSSSWLDVMAASKTALLAVVS